MKKLKIQIIYIENWGNFLFVDNFLKKAGTTMEKFDSDIGRLIKQVGSCEVEYVPKTDMKFNKKKIDSCPYSTFYDVVENTNIDDFSKWFKASK